MYGLLLLSTEIKFRVFEYYLIQPYQLIVIRVQRGVIYVLSPTTINHSSNSPLNTEQVVKRTASHKGKLKLDYSTYRQTVSAQLLAVQYGYGVYQQVAYCSITVQQRVKTSFFFTLASRTRQKQRMTIRLEGIPEKVLTLHRLDCEVVVVVLRRHVMWNHKASESLYGGTTGITLIKRGIIVIAICAVNLGAKAIPLLQACRTLNKD
jgi:hypothetical protein